MGRMGKPEEIAAAAVFLSSPQSAFTSGTNMVIDGCMSHRVNFSKSFVTPGFEATLPEACAGSDPSLPYVESGR